MGDEQKPKKWVDVDFAPSDSALPPAPTSLSKLDKDISISVSQPVKQGEGMNAYISYKIEWEKGSVIRRYSDFVWLHGNLTMEYPGIIVPPLPEKLLVGRFSTEFIESRRRALEKFLNRTKKHPELRQSEFLDYFLTSTDFKTDDKSTPPTLKSRHTGGGIMQWIDEAVQQISSTLGSGVVLEKTPADIEFEEIQAYVEGLEPLMTELFKHAQGLTKRAREMAEGFFDFGVSFSLLGQSEGDNLQSGLVEVGKCADQLSILTAEQAEKEAMYFEDPILDYIRIVQAVKVALQKRCDAKLTYETSIGELQSRTAVLDKLSKQSGREDKLQQAQMEKSKAQTRVDEAKREFNLITDRVIREIERFKIEKLVDFKSIILDYIHLQIEYNRRVEQEWQRIIPKLQEIQLLESANVEKLSSEAAE